jgi:hypothetical protein
MSSSLASLPSREVLLAWWWARFAAPMSPVGWRAEAEGVDSLLYVLKALRIKRAGGQ